MKRFGVGTQLILAFILVSVLSISVQLFISSRSVSKTSTQAALDLLTEMGASYSSSFQNIFDRGFRLAVDEKAFLQALKKNAAQNGTLPDRGLAAQGLKAMAVENLWSIGLWTAWEPNAFDGRDADYVNQPGHDQTGRLVFSVNLDDKGEMEVHPLLGYDQSGDGDYYQLALQNKRQIMLEPYEYDFSGKRVLVTTMTEPIIENGRVVGAAGVDLSLDEISRMMSAIRPMEVGQAILLSPGGIIVGHSDPSLVGKKFASTPRGRLLGEELSRLRNGGDHVVKVIEAGWGQGEQDAAAAIYTFSPGGTDRNWAFISLVPMSRVLENSQALIQSGLVSGAGVLVLAIIIGLLAVKLIVGGLTSRIMNVVMDLDDISNVINRESKDISDSSHSISAGAENQAASLEETSAALEEISSMTKKTLENVRTADQGAKATKQMVETGGREMQDMDQAMAEIDDSASKINNIIKVIEEIAFQTNLLALNASVEAARAGEAGAGFAVVADEVRNLAIRSAESVSSTKSLIDLTIARVKNGNQVASRLYASFHNIEKSSGEIESLVAEINEAASSQDVGIDQVNQAVGVLNSITNENVHSVSTLANAASDLSGETDKMARVVELLLATVGGKH